MGREPAATGDDAVFEHLYPGLRRWAAATGPADVDPDDLIQEAVARTLRHHALCDLDDPGAYLRRAIVNLAANHRRGLARWRSAVTRLAVTTSLDAWDVAALRFGVAGILLSPVVVQRGLARDRLGRLGLAVIIAGVGAPYVLVAAAGLRFAPASDQGALNPGCMPLFVALIAAAVLRERLATTRKLGLALILAGALINTDAA